MVQGIFYIKYLLDKNNFDNEIYVRIKITQRVRIIQYFIKKGNGYIKKRTP